MKIILTKVRYLEHMSEPIFFGHFQGKTINGTKEQLLYELAHILTPITKPSSKKSKIIPGTEKLEYTGKFLGATKYHKEPNRRAPLGYDIKATETDLDTEFPEIPFKREVQNIMVEVDFEITNATWKYQTTRKKKI